MTDEQRAPANAERTTQELLPCPFCGEAPDAFGSGEEQRGLMIECVSTRCEVNPHVSYYDHDAAKAVWNRRTSPAAKAGAMEEGEREWWESDFSKLQQDPLPPWTSASCGGEKCSVCGEPATAKIGEEIMHDDPAPNRHNLTAYVCTEHFNMVLRPYLAAHRSQQKGAGE